MNHSTCCEIHVTGLGEFEGVGKTAKAAQLDAIRQVGFALARVFFTTATPEHIPYDRLIPLFEAAAARISGFRCVYGHPLFHDVRVVRETQGVGGLTLRVTMDERSFIEATGGAQGGIYLAGIGVLCGLVQFFKVPTHAPGRCSLGV